jgi:ATP-dependent RNA helicase DeaD
MTTFNERGLKNELLKAIEDLGFTSPTKIQEQAIDHLANETSDLIALSQTGTGKTAAFSLPILNQIDPNNKKIQAIILCPTRELCMQIAKDIESYSKYIHGVSSVAVYGGASIENQLRDLKKGVQIVIGTPGRTLDLINRKNIDLSFVDWVVLDEADEMLSMGFKDDLDDILRGTPKEKRTLLFSATMPKEIAEIAKKYMHKPAKISAGDVNVSSVDVSHEYYLVDNKNRFNAIKRIADANPDIYAIIFCRTRRETQEVADKLMQEGYNADALHGDLSQAQRDYVMNRFRNQSLQLLVATDVAARGLDVNNLTHVINFNLPDEIEAYIHRSGRTGRAGKKGVSLVIITKKEAHKIKQLENKIGKKMEAKMVPSGIEICEKQLLKLVGKIESTEVNESEIERYLPAVYEKLASLNREELIKKFISNEFNRFLSYYQNSDDLNNISDKPTRERERDRGASSDNFQKMFVNIGKNEGLNPNLLIKLINENTPNSSIDFGKIEILKSFSFIEVDKNEAEFLAKVMRNIDFNGANLNIEISGGARTGGGSEGRSSNRERSGGGRSGGFRSGGGEKSTGGFRSGGGEKSTGGFRSGGGDRKSGSGFKSGGGSSRSGGGGWSGKPKSSEGGSRDEKRSFKSDSAKSSSRSVKRKRI